MMTGDAVQKVADLAVDAAGTKVEIDGREYSTTALHDPRKKLEEPTTIQLHSLDGLIDYLAANLDELKANDCMVHVASPTEVRIVSRLQGEFQQRFEYAAAKTRNITQGFFGVFWLLEEFIIALQARFVQTDDRASVLGVVGNVKDEHVKTVGDDGTSQQVTARQGVATVENVTVPNPVTLAPFRSFPEIDQPASPFILRMQSAGGELTAALFEADGGAWENEAIGRITAYLDGKVQGLPLIR